MKRKLFMKRSQSRAGSGFARVMTMLTLMLTMLCVQSANALTLTCLRGSGFGEGEGCQYLFDGTQNTKWGTWDGWDEKPVYAVAKATMPIAPTTYSLMIASDTEDYPDRNWKSWRIFGANFASDADAVYDAEGWVLLDEKVNQEMTTKSSAEVKFDLSNPDGKFYSYFMIVVDAICSNPNWGEYTQMDEFWFRDFKTDLPEALFSVTLKNGTADADKWTISPNPAAEGSPVTVTYSGTKKVKSVKAVKKGDAAPEKTYYYGDGYYTVDGGSGGITTKEQHNSLVDNNLGTKWGQNKPNGGWYIEFHTASAIQVNGYMLRTGNDTQGQSNRNPTDWVLKGKKNSGDSWTVIDTKVNNNDLPNENDAETDFDVATPGEYRYFRLEISNNKGNGGFMQLSEMRLFKYVTWNATTKQATFTMLDGDVELEVEYYAESNLYLSKDALADKASIAVTAGELGVQFGEDGKSANTITEGTAMTVKYNGTKKVIGVEAVKKAAPATVPVTAITLNKTETSIKVGATETLSVTAVAPDNATDKTYTWKTSDETKATVDQDGKVTAIAAGTVTIYAEANDGSGVKGNCSVTVTPAIITVTWNNDDITGTGMGTSFSKDGVTITAEEIDFSEKNFMHGGTFTTTLGNFTKIEVTTGYFDESGTGWSGSKQKKTWTGTPASSVSFSADIMGMAGIEGTTKFVFTIEPTN